MQDSIVTSTAWEMDKNETSTIPVPIRPETKVEDERHSIVTSDT